MGSLKKGGRHQNRIRVEEPSRSDTCDLRKNGKRCSNKAHMEVHYSKSGKKPEKGWIEFIPAKSVTGRGLVRDRSGKSVKKFTWDFPRDMTWSYLCRKHFKAENGAGRVIMWCPA